MRIPNPRMALLILVGALSLVSCQPKRAAITPVEGVWTKTNGTESIEFSKGGTLSISNQLESLKGHYSWQGDQRMKIELPAKTLIMQATVSGEELVLTDPMGQAVIYRRVK